MKTKDGRALKKTKNNKQQIPYDVVCVNKIECTEEMIEDIQKKLKP